MTLIGLQLHTSIIGVMFRFIVVEIDLLCLFLDELANQLHVKLSCCNMCQIHQSFLPSNPHMDFY